MNEENEKELYQNQSSKPTKTWFFERTGDKFIFACDEAEAWAILYNRGNWMRRDFKMLGVSDGTTYFDIIKNSKQEARELFETKKRLQSDLQRYVATEEKLVFQDLKDDTDPMVIKVKEKIGELQLKVDEIDTQLKDINKTIIEKAFNAELEKARGNFEQPSNHDVITPAGNREKILTNLGR